MLRALSRPLSSRSLKFRSLSVESPITVEWDTDGFATLTLSNPRTKNSFGDETVALLQDALDRLKEEGDMPRALFLRSTGTVFSAGADLRWMERTTTYPRADNMRDAAALGRMLHTLNSLPCPTIALVQGPAFGGGVGLVSCCDVAIAVEGATFFQLSEVKLGLIPATISPYVVQKLGAGHARRFFLTGEAISASKAYELGLVHELVDHKDGLEDWAQRLRKAIGLNSPMAVAASKELIRSVADSNIPIESLIQDTAERLCDARESPDGKAGLRAFFEKKKAPWMLTR